MTLRPLIIAAIAFALNGCVQSPYDKCVDSKDYLWNPAIDDNRYEGNEAYWNAVKSCE